MSNALIGNDSADDWIKVNDDGSVIKRIITPGSEDALVPQPNVHRVLVKYVGTLFPSNEEFDRSKRDFAFDLGRRKVIPAWDMTVATMRLGEKCIMRCSPRYGYGASGSKPVIPPNASLQFEMQLTAAEERKLEPAEIAAKAERERIQKLQKEREEARLLKEEQKREAEERKKSQPDRAALLKEKLANKNKKKGGRSR